MKFLDAWPKWSLEALVGLFGALITLGFWQGFRLNEEAHVRNLTRLAAKGVQADLYADLEARVFAQALVATLWDGEMPSEAEWAAHAKLFLRHYPDCISIEWVDSAYRVRRVSPALPGTAEKGRDLSEEAQLQPVLQKAMNAPQEAGFISTENTADGGLLGRIVTPIYHEGRIRGFIVTALDFRRSLKSMLRDHSGLGYSIVVTDGSQQLYRMAGTSRANDSGVVEQAELRIGDLHWRVRVGPDAELWTQMRSRLPLVVLLVGSILCVLLVASVSLAQTSRSRSQMLEASNQQLQNEILERQRAEQEARNSRARLAGVLEISPDAIVSVNEQQQITLFNQGAEKTWGYKAEEVLGEPLDLLIPHAFRAEHRRHVAEFAKSPNPTIRMCQRRTVMGLHSSGREFPLEASLSKLEIGGETIYTAILRDISERVAAEEELRRAHQELEHRVAERTLELAQTNSALEAEIAVRKNAETSLRELSARLLQLQDEERRRIARELHDSTSQTMVALSMTMANLQAILPADPDPNAIKLLHEATTLLDQCSDEVRTISYLLHPPLLDDLGLEPVLHWCANGFSQRSGIQVSLDVNSGLGRFPREIELALFRIVQEALTNIHRHSRSRTANIALASENGDLTLKISDHGCGIPERLLKTMNTSPAVLGVGIAGMHERIRQLGGELQIASSGKGTEIVARVPVPDRGVAAAS